MSLATRQTLERAFAAYLPTISLEIDGVMKKITDYTATFKGQPEEAVPLGIYCICGEVGEDGAIPEEWQQLRMPAIVISCPRSQRVLGGWDECSVAVTAITTPDEIGAPAQVQARVGWLGALFAEDNIPLIVAALNAPRSGPDLRPVKGLTVVGMICEGEDHLPDGHQVIGALKLQVCAYGTPG